MLNEKHTDGSVTKENKSSTAYTIPSVFAHPPIRCNYSGKRKQRTKGEEDRRERKNEQCLMSKDVVGQESVLVLSQWFGKYVSQLLFGWHPL
jgi:hypothetical protein